MTRYVHALTFFSQAPGTQKEWADSLLVSLRANLEYILSPETAPPEFTHPSPAWKRLAEADSAVSHDRRTAERIAREILQEATREAPNEGNTAMQRRLHAAVKRLRAFVAWWDGHLKDAVTMYGEALDEAETVGFSFLQAQIQGELARIFIQLGDAELAAERAEEAELVMPRTPDPTLPQRDFHKVRGWISDARAQVAEMNGDPETGMELFLHGLEEFTRARSTSGYAVLLARFAEVAERAGHPDLALGVHNIAAAPLLKHTVRANTQNQKGAALERRGRHAEAHEIYQSAMNVGNEVDSQSYVYLQSCLGYMRTAWWLGHVRRAWNIWSRIIEPLCVERGAHKEHGDGLEFWADRFQDKRQWKRTAELRSLQLDVRLRAEAETMDRRIRLSKLAVELKSMREAHQRETAHRQELEHRNRLIETEHQRAESLLVSLFPESVMEQLKAEGAVKPEAFPQVAVLFTDFVGFTSRSSEADPEVIIRALNDIFSAYDEITSRYAIDRIKTIGDAYMAAIGLGGERGAHADRLVAAAGEMCRFLDHYNSLAPAGEPPWTMRLGAHVGPVVAGVVGKRRFQFDIFGDTVNTASRMEHLSTSDHMTMSETGWSALSDWMRTALDRHTEHISVDIKGKGTALVHRFDPRRSVH